MEEGVGSRNRGFMSVIPEMWESEEGALVQLSLKPSWEDHHHLIQFSLY